MKNDCFIEGQINIFDLPNIEGVKPKGIIIKEERVIDKLYYIIKLYTQSCSRIVKIFSGALLVKLDDKTLYFNAIGINKFNLPKYIGIMKGNYNSTFKFCCANRLYDRKYMLIFYKVESYCIKHFSRSKL